MGKNPIVSVAYEDERISIKNSLLYIKCVLHLSCVVHGPIYGRFRGCNVNGFLCVFINRPFTVQPINRPMDHTGEMKHILCKVSCLLLKPFRFRRFQKRQVFLHTNPYIQNVMQQCRCLGYLLVCYTAVFRVVTQRSSPGALRDDTKNGCVADQQPVGLEKTITGLSFAEQAILRLKNRYKGVGSTHILQVSAPYIV